MPVDSAATAATQARYQRIAPFYDRMEGLAERRYQPWRRRLWGLVQGAQVLELGVGTGKNLPFYPPGVSITAIDLTPGMLERARRRATQLGVDVTLQIGDAQQLDFPDNTFNEVVATFVFCSVPNPVLGLQEARRVLKPGGRLLLLEHMRAANPVLGTLMDALNPVVVRVVGANINRRTVENIRRSSLGVQQVEDVGMGGIFKLIVAQK
jgi:ubiquinone/menaquinone biosynthesis C-methylase UbiE